MISDKHQCIFVHLRRTGGNSIELSLGGIILLDREGRQTNHWDNRLHRGDTPYKKDFRGHYMHDTAMAIEKQFPTKFREYSKFSIVRNPWDQMISAYLRLNAHDEAGIHFKSWLQAYNLREGTVPAYSLFDHQGKCMVDEIGRFENLSEDFIRICAKFGISQDPLNVTNASSKRHYSEYYDREKKELVARLFEKDIRYFGYKFSG